MIAANNNKGFEQARIGYHVRIIEIREKSQWGFFGMFCAPDGSPIGATLVNVMQPHPCARPRVPQIAPHKGDKPRGRPSFIQGVTVGGRKDDVD